MERDPVLPQIMFWRGKSVDQCTREELIEALSCAYEQIMQWRAMHRAVASSPIDLAVYARAKIDA